MKKLFILIILFLVTSFLNAQSSKRVYKWVPTKESFCRINQIQFGVGSKFKLINLNASYSWGKEKCTEQEYISPQKIKVKKGIHNINGVEYYSDGDKFYKIEGNACSALGISKSQVFK